MLIWSDTGWNSESTSGGQRPMLTEDEALVRGAELFSPSQFPRGAPLQPKCSLKLVGSLAIVFFRLFYTRRPRSKLQRSASKSTNRLSFVTHGELRTAQAIDPESFRDGRESRLAASPGKLFRVEGQEQGTYVSVLGMGIISMDANSVGRSFGRIKMLILWPYTESVPPKSIFIMFGEHWRLFDIADCAFRQ